MIGKRSLGDSTDERNRQEVSSSGKGSQRSLPASESHGSASGQPESEGWTTRSSSPSSQGISEFTQPVGGTDPLIGRSIFNKYRILSRIEAGGMGVVYKGYQSAMSRTVAIKMLASDKISDEEALKRFEREARSASQLKHPSNVTIFDFGQTEDGSLYIVMEYLDGCFLDKLIQRQGPMPAAKVVDLLPGVCGALAEAHSIGIIHRDIKPANLAYLTKPVDLIKVVDFGAARLQNSALTQSGTLGTPQYMSPEQILGEELDARSDIFSLGLVAYELLTGHYPFGDRQIDTPTACHRLLHMVPEPFSEICPERTIPAEIEAVVFKMLAKDRANRFGSAEEVRRKLSILQLHQQLLQRKADEEEARGGAPPSHALDRPHGPHGSSASTRELADSPPGAQRFPRASQEDPSGRGTQDPCPANPSDQREASSGDRESAAPEQRRDQASVPSAHKNRESRKVLNNAGSPTTMLAEIDRFLRTGQFTPALTLLRSTLRNDPSNQHALQLAQQIHSQAGARLAYDEQVWLDGLISAINENKTVASRRHLADMVWVGECSFESAYGGRVSTCGFFIDVTPVTNREYAQFVKNLGILPPGIWPGESPLPQHLDHPVVGVSLETARRYAEWRNKRLPTSTEWEIAARAPDERRFPWGDTWDSDVCHCPEQRASGTAPVRRHAGTPSGSGCVDMVGNVWEWAENDPSIPCSDSRRYVFGGSFRHPCAKNGHIARTTVPCDSSSWVLGFRCAKDHEDV